MRNIAGKALGIVAIGVGASGLAMQQAHAETIYKAPIGNVQTLELRMAPGCDQATDDLGYILDCWQYGPGAFVGTGSAGPLRKG